MWGRGRRHSRPVTTGLSRPSPEWHTPDAVHRMERYARPLALASGAPKGMVCMSYPKRVYFGDRGEVNAHFLPADTASNVGESSGHPCVHHELPGQPPIGCDGLFSSAHRRSSDEPVGGGKNPSIVQKSRGVSSMWISQ